MSQFDPGAAMQFVAEYLKVNGWNQHGVAALARDVYRQGLKDGEEFLLRKQAREREAAPPAVPFEPQIPGSVTGVWQSARQAAYPGRIIDATEEQEKDMLRRIGRLPEEDPMPVSAQPVARKFAFDDPDYRNAPKLFPDFAGSGAFIPEEKVEALFGGGVGSAWVSREKLVRLLDDAMTAGAEAVTPMSTPGEDSLSRIAVALEKLAGTINPTGEYIEVRSRGENFRG